MENITPVPPIPVLPSRPARWLASLALLAVALAMTVPIYGGWLSGDVQRIFRYGFTLLWGILAIGAIRIERARPYLLLLLGLFGVSLGLALAYLAAHSPLSGLGGASSTPRGAAAEKIFTEVIPVSAAIFFSAWLSRRSLGSLGLRGGRAWQSQRGRLADPAVGIPRVHRTQDSVNFGMGALPAPPIRRCPATDSPNRSPTLGMTIPQRSA